MLCLCVERIHNRVPSLCCDLNGVAKIVFYVAMTLVGGTTPVKSGLFDGVFNLSFSSVSTCKNHDIFTPFSYRLFIVEHIHRYIIFFTLF